MATKKVFDDPSERKHSVDLTNYAGDTFDLRGHELEAVYDDVMLVKYVDETEEGEVQRNGIVLPATTNTLKAWRVGEVILTGDEVKNVKPGDRVCFPNDKGLPAQDLTVAGVGRVKKSVFINESRLFGKCKIVE